MLNKYEHLFYSPDDIYAPDAPVIPGGFLPSDSESDTGSTKEALYSPGPTIAGALRKKSGGKAQTIAAAIKEYEGESRPSGDGITVFDMFMSVDHNEGVADFEVDAELESIREAYTKGTVLLCIKDNANPSIHIITMPVFYVAQSESMLLSTYIVSNGGPEMLKLTPDVDGHLHGSLRME